MDQFMIETITAARLSAILIWVMLTWRVLFQWNEPGDENWLKLATPWWIANILVMAFSIIFFFSPEHIARANHYTLPQYMSFWLQIGGIIGINISGLCTLMALALSRGKTGVEAASIISIPICYLVVSYFL